MVCTGELRYSNSMRLPCHIILFTCRFKSIRFLLTDTKIPRSTKQLVANVASKLHNDPGDGQRVMLAIQAISDQATHLLTNRDVTRTQLIDHLSVSLRFAATMAHRYSSSRLQRLIDENHDHLAHLGVSHPALEIIRAKTAALPYRLSTKLTGAGGGGCAVTLLPDGELYVLHRYAAS
jgi:mevalonate kinase